MAQEYNTQEYNEGQYNVDSSVAVLNLSIDSFPLAEALLGKTIIIGQVFSEPLSMSDALTKDLSIRKIDFLTILEQSTKKNVDLKGLIDTLDIDLWLTIDRNDNNSKFTEQ